jgi:hypothetical protein
MLKSRSRFDDNNALKLTCGRLRAYANQKKFINPIPKGGASLLMCIGLILSQKLWFYILIEACQTACIFFFGSVGYVILYANS